MHRRVLQVNSGGLPLGFVSWQRAIAMLWLGTARELVNDPDLVLCSPSWSIEHPLIIQLVDYVKIKPLKDGQVVKRILLARDGWECQYCHKSITIRTATIDHVKPVSAYLREGKTRQDAHVWENVVASCGPCNSKKGSRLPHECGMYPKKTPRKPNYVQINWGGHQYHPVQKEYVAQYFRINPQILGT